MWHFVHIILTAIKWGGGTQIVPGWQVLKQAYNEEFGNRKEEDKPLLMAVVITDGEADDVNEFAQIIRNDQSAYILIVLVGFGEDYQKAVFSFNNIQQVNKRVKVMSMGSQTDPHVIASTLLKMVN